MTDSDPYGEKFDQVREHIQGLKIHIMVSPDLIRQSPERLLVPLCQATDEEILAEIARRKLDVHANITEVSNRCLHLISIKRKT
jgi:hypothetical protein